MLLQKKQIENKLTKNNLKESFTVKAAKKKWEFKSSRGLIYLGHIPHGFFEEQMKDYFSQFGRVTKVRLVRSSKVHIFYTYIFISFIYKDIRYLIMSITFFLISCRLVLVAVMVTSNSNILM